MSPELIAILGVGVALAALMFHVLRRMEERIRQDMQRSEERMRQDMQGSEKRMRQDVQGSEERMESRFTSHDGRFTSLETRVSDIGERMAKVEGLLEGLRDTITGRQAA